MERDKNYDLELAKYIWSILKSNLPVLMSWGVEIETVKVITVSYTHLTLPTT